MYDSFDCSVPLSSFLLRPTGYCSSVETEWQQVEEERNPIVTNTNIKITIETVSQTGSCIKKSDHHSSNLHTRSLVNHFAVADTHVPGRSSAEELAISRSSPSELFLRGSTNDASANIPLSDASMDLSNQLSPLQDDVPTLDELLLLEDDELDVSILSKPLLTDDNKFPVELDPTLLFPEPVELLDQSPEPVKGNDEPVTSSSSSPSDVQSPPKVYPPVAAPPRRKRRKDELDYLRVKAKELEEQLKTLNEREDVEGKGEEAGDRGVSVWRKVARRQLEGQKRARKENEKLRGMMEGHLMIIQNLEKLLRKRSAMEESGAWESERKRVRVGNEEENVIFDRILTQLDGQYKETDAVFLQNSQARRKVDGQHVQVKPDGPFGMFMEFLATKTVPFEIQTTATQFWRCMAQPHLKLRDGHYSLIDGTEDTLSAKMAFTVQHKKHQLLKDAWFAVKRFIEEDRCVFVWACETKVEGTLSAAQSMHHRDTGWTLVERYQTSEDGLESTIIQSCVRVRTDLPEVMPRSQDEVALLTEIVSSSFLENLDDIHQTVEDALVDEAMRRS